MNLFFSKIHAMNLFFFGILEAFGKLLGGVCQPLGPFFVRFCKHVGQRKGEKVFFHLGLCQRPKIGNNSQTNLPDFILLPIGELVEPILNFNKSRS